MYPGPTVHSGQPQVASFGVHWVVRCQGEGGTSNVDRREVEDYVVHNGVTHQHHVRDIVGGEPSTTGGAPRKFV